MGLAVVDEHREVVRSGEGKLPLEDVALNVGRRQIAVVVEPDLADRPRPGFAGKALEVRPARSVERGSVVRMNPHGRVEQIRMTGRQRERGLRRGEVPARDQDAREPGGPRPIEHRFAVSIEALVLEVGVRVDDPRQALAAAPTAQPATSSSTRGKIGSAVPVCRSADAAPHAASDARPGPPAPRSSYGGGTPSCS